MKCIGLEFTCRSDARLIFLTTLVAGCGVASQPATQEQQASLKFVETTREAGLGEFRHENGGEGDFWFPEQMGAGGGFIDYDGDGWEDILLVGGGSLSATGPEDVQAIRLYRNNRDGTFTEVTDEVNLGGIRAYGTGVVVADYDNDGDQDFYLTTLGENLLFRNDLGSSGTRFFTEVGRESGVAEPAKWSSSALFFDADGDGHLDLYVAGYATWSIETEVRCSRAGGRPDYCPPATYRSARSYYYRNNGDGTFTDRTAEAGFAGSPGKSLAVAEWDFNDDGRSDVVVVNDGERDLLYLNNGDGTFSERGMLSGMALGEHGEARAGMGVDIGVVDDTGQPTIVVGNFSSEMIGVYRRSDSGWFIDRAAASRVGGSSLTTLAFGVLFFDADLDGYLDLIVANGHVYLDPIDGSRYRQPPHLFSNQRDGTFRDVAPSAGDAFRRPMVARAVAVADYDRDGDLDVLITENHGPVHLLRNDSPRGGVLRVRLESRALNRDALGAHVIAVVSEARMHRRVRTGSSFLAQSEKTLTFGLGNAAGVDTLIVHWPSGLTDRYEDLSPGYEITILEGQGIRSREAFPIRAEAHQASR